jgi:hypothetical protein
MTSSKYAMSFLPVKFEVLEGAVMVSPIPKVIANKMNRLIRRHWRFGSKRLKKVMYLHL